jgi:hypothetical protein
MGVGTWLLQVPTACQVPTCVHNPPSRRTCFNTFPFTSSDSSGIAAGSANRALVGRSALCLWLWCALNRMPRLPRMRAGRSRLYVYTLALALAA